MKLILAGLALLTLSCGQLQPSGGKDGLQGPQGPRGMHGNQGLQGIQGLDGARGFSGQDGSQGNQGVEGPQGPRGIQGIAGGIPCTISHNDKTNRIECSGGQVIEWARIPLISICHFEFKDNQKWCKQIDDCPITDAMVTHFGHTHDYKGKCGSNCKRL